MGQTAPAPAEHDAGAAAVRSKIKHVFVIFQENHSFDNYFGTYPGADNLASAQAEAHGFRQYDPIGKTWITPFRITDPDIESLSQGRPVLLAKMNGGKMDGYVAAQEANSAKKVDPADARILGIETMAHYDCDTVPFLWKYAHAFTLFDHIFQAIIGPSTPNNISAIAAQAGQTQAARTPASAIAANDKGVGVPVLNDTDPAFGPYSEPDKTTQLSQQLCDPHAAAERDGRRAGHPRHRRHSA